MNERNGKYKLNERDRLNKETIVADSCIAWYKNGKLHREDGPAIEWKNGNKEWYKNGKPHRIDGPALEYPEYGNYWYQHGKLHRENGPAIDLYYGGEKNWYKNGKLHREDGPAIEWGDGRKRWFLEGNEFTEKKFIQKIGLNKDFTNLLLSITEDDRQTIVRNISSIRNLAISTQGTSKKKKP